MKRCDQIRGMILADYIDGRLDQAQAESVEGHLLDCSECRAFFKEVKNNTALPFQHVLPEAVPPGLWDAIRQNIEREKRPASLAGFADQLKGLLVLPRLVPFFASLVVMLFVGSVAVNTIQVHQAQDRDQGEYLASLLAPTGATGADEGTPIEHYFL